MKRLKTYLILLLIAGQVLNVQAQEFDQKQQNWINKYNLIINSPNSHDTAVASSYMELMTILHLSNIDTIFYLSKKVRTVCEKD